MTVWNRLIAGSALVLGVCSLASAGDVFKWINLREAPQWSVDPQVQFRDKRDVSDQSASMGWFEYGLSLTAPVYADERQDFTLLPRVRFWDIDTDAVLPHTPAAFPDRLANVNISGLYRMKLDNGMTFGVVGGVGSPSDKPFDSPDEVIVNAMAFLRIPDGPRNAWVAMLSYNSNREFARHLPLPGGGYSYAAGRGKLTALAGFPYSMIRYKPVDRLTLRASYLFPRTVSVEAAYEVLDDVEVFAGFDWDNKRFLRSGRPKSEDRLFYYEKRVGGGLRWQITDHASLSGSVGWAFDRFWFEGESYDDRSQNRLDLSDGPCAGISFRMQF